MEENNTTTPAFLKSTAGRTAAPLRHTGMAGAAARLRQNPSPAVVEPPSAAAADGYAKAARSGPSPDMKRAR